MSGVIFETKSGRFAVRARRVIDCTGVADVAYLADCRVSVLDVKDRMGMTLVFNVKGVEKQNPETQKKEMDNIQTAAIPVVHCERRGRGRQTHVG